MTIPLLLATAVLIAAALSLIMAGAWLVQQRTGNSGWVDTIWTFGLGACGVALALAPISRLTAPEPRQVLVALLAAVWSLRLGMHIALRTRGIIDDPRYAQLIRRWGDDAAVQMFWLLQKQAVVSIPLALAIMLAAQNPLPHLRFVDALGAAILILAVACEGLADLQLRHFRSNEVNARNVCDRGLWRWSRHPNYFFEWLGWLAYPLIAIDPTGSYPYGFIAVVGPVCMYWLLVHVSGIPPIEEHLLKSRGAAYQAYQSRTNAFFPGRPGPGSKTPMRLS
jgi:steroid 5-alpha reductase family enzyme